MREPAWRRTGKTPDYRFSLANERTFLAWIRTGLGFVAAGVAIAAVARLTAGLGVEFMADRLVSDIDAAQSAA